MKYKDQKNKEILSSKNATEGKDEVFNKLLASKKVVQRNRMTVQFSSDLSQVPKVPLEKKSTPSLRVKRVVCQQSPRVEKVVLTKVKPLPKPLTKNAYASIDFDAKIAQLPEVSVEGQTDIEKKKTEKNKQRLTTTIPFNGFKSMPRIKTGHLSITEEGEGKKKVNTSSNEKKNIDEKERISQGITPSLPQKDADKMSPMAPSTSSHINGGNGAPQHVTDTPYVEQPTVKGKNLAPRSQEVHDILSYVPSWMVRWGNTVILLILGGILVMSYYIKYPDVVSGVLTINSTYPPVPLVTKATGPITLFKEDKEAVVMDEPIGVIKNTAEYQDMMQLKAALADFQDKLNKGWSFSFYELPKGLQLGELQSAYNQLFLKLKEQRIQHKSTKNNNTRKSNINQQLAELAAIKKAKEQSLSIKYQEYLKTKNLLDTRYKILYEKGSISAEQLNAKESEVRNLLDIYQSDRMAFNEIKKRMLDLNGNKIELDFQKEDQQILSQSSLVAAFEELKATLHKWERTYVLKAPIAGKLNFIRFTKNEMYLQQDQPIANIIPTMGIDETTASMIGELIIPSIGSGKTAIGQKVNIELNDYPKKQYGVVLGKVESISTITVPIADGNGMTGYKVIVSFPKGLENTLKKEIQFKHNMQGKAEIITEDIRLIERFFHELRDLVDAN